MDYKRQFKYHTINNKIYHTIMIQKTNLFGETAPRMFQLQNMQFTFTKWRIAYLFIISNVAISSAQVTLSADGPGDTYELINSKFAPTGNVVEAPDQTTVSGQTVGTHPEFGRHIAEVWDDNLQKYVFEFYAHLDTGSTAVLDNDVSTSSTDRQRVEIKTYGSSPANLKGTTGETVTYKWLFYVPVGFKPTSTFSHLHQVKAVDGDDSNPIFSLTARKGTPNKLEVNYVQSATSGTTKLANLDLSLFEGIWVDITETVKVGPTGTYSILIKRVDNNAVIVNINKENILTIRPDNSFIRPKWGIYRSIADKANMRDEAVRFADFSIAEGVLSTDEVKLNKEIALYPNPVQDSFMFSDFVVNSYSNYTIYDSQGKLILSNKIANRAVDISFLNAGVYFVKLYADKVVSDPIKIIKK